MREEKKTENTAEISAAETGQEKRTVCTFALEWLQALVWSVVLVALCFTFGVRIIGVDGNSMEPTLQNNDRLIVLSSLWSDVRDGDVVVLRKDSFMTAPIVKRVIATEGQTIDIDFSSGTVTVDGAVLEEPYLKELTLTAGDVDFPFTVSPGCVFVMGDNRNASTDSRWSWLGEVDRRYILGKAVCVLFPGVPADGGGPEWSRIGLVK